jgi:hypothetical protein
MVDAQASRLAALEAGLASDVASERDAALTAYGSLGAADVPDMLARLHELGRRRSDPLEITRVLAAFRHAVGSRRADDAVDLGPGVALTLQADREAITVRVGAAVLLERAGERIATTESLACVPELTRWDGDGMRLEGRRIAMRVGPRLAPVVIEARSHEDRETRQWAEWAAARLGLDEPGRFVAGLEAELVPDVLRAFARAHVMSAVPVAISFVDAPRSSTRAAAREALNLYGQNSIWVARDAYRVRTGETADLQWGWRRTLDALFSVIDAAQEERVTADLAAANEAIARGDRVAAATSLDAVLRGVPGPSTTAVGSASLRLAELDLGAEDLDAARAHLGIAVRLPVASADEPRRDALRILLDADERLAGGVLDAGAYARAVEADPTCVRCAELHERFAETSGAAGAGAPWKLWVAAAAFLLLAVLLWPSAPSRVVPSESPAEGADATLS